ncbi:MAG: DUF4845 domain-containing protein, partial [Bryobacteraceae bacterium]
MDTAPPSPVAQKVRLAIAILVFAALIGSLFMMVPPYLDNLRLQRGIKSVLVRPDVLTATEDSIRNAVVARAVQDGMSISPSQIRVEKLAGLVRVEVIYTVRVEFPLYSVDLHFRPFLEDEMIGDFT